MNPEDVERIKPDPIVIRTTRINDLVVDTYVKLSADFWKALLHER